MLSNISETNLWFQIHEGIYGNNIVKHAVVIAPDALSNIRSDFNRIP